MTENIRNIIEKMYKDVNNRPLEIVFYDNRLKKSIGIRKPSSVLLRELDDEFDEKDKNPN